MFRLGKTLPEAHREWASRVEANTSNKNIDTVIDRYMNEVAPMKAVRTYKENTRQSVLLKKAFGHMDLTDIKPRHIYAYIEARTAKVSAKREVALFSHILSTAVKWGYIDSHPFKGEVRLEGNKARDRYIEDWEVLECFKLEPLPWCRTKLMQAYIAFAIVTGLRKQDILSLKISDFTDKGIEVNTKKTKKPIVIKWTPTLKYVAQQLVDQRPVDISPFVVCNKRGESYYNNGSSGFDTIWKRFMKRCLKDTGLKTPFTMHDLRAKCASDFENEADAQKLLAHANIGMTKTYRRKPETVRPLR